jgi:hypothetical protein
MMSIIFTYGIDSQIIIILVGSVLGVFQTSLNSLFISFSSELTYPIAQGSATGFLYAGSQAFGFISGMLWIIILDKTSKWKVHLLFIVHAFLLVLSLVVNLNTR